jgi:hypothetical protein
LCVAMLLLWFCHVLALLWSCRIFAVSLPCYLVSVCGVLLLQSVAICGASSRTKRSFLFAAQPPHSMLGGVNGGVGVARRSSENTS